jgi:hypothetical protein
MPEDRTAKHGVACVTLPLDTTAISSCTMAACRLHAVLHTAYCYFLYPHAASTCLCLCLTVTPAFLTLLCYYTTVPLHLPLTTCFCSACLPACCSATFWQRRGAGAFYR